MQCTLSALQGGCHASDMPGACSAIPVMLVKIVTRVAGYSSEFYRARFICIQ